MMVCEGLYSTLPILSMLREVRRSKRSTGAGPTSHGHCCWSTVSGRHVTLTDTDLLSLSEAERLVLQKIALAKLQALNLGCSVSIPKECTGAKRKRRVLRMLKRKSHSANIASLQEEIKNKEDAADDCRPAGLVFGIPLAKCITNDLDLQRRRSSASSAQLSSTPRTISNHRASYPANRMTHRKSSSSSMSSENPTQNGSKENVDKDYQASLDSLTGSEASSRNTSSILIDALSLSTNQRHVCPEDNLRNLSSPQRHVPHIVSACFEHLQTYGIGTLGIFRVGGSKKRTKQLHDEFDSGKSVVLAQEHNCHDVAALLKEYFRDLPEPLLTRDLYSAFVATRKLDSHSARVWATKLLIALLPVTSRDTLWALLKFLANVASHSTDSIDSQGNNVAGNKMDTHNLGTVFGPNVLHKAKSGGVEDFQVEDFHRAEERKEIIAVIKHMIDHTDEIFTVPASLHDEVIKYIADNEPQLADKILKDLSMDFNADIEPEGTSSVFGDDSDAASMPRSPSSDHEFVLQYPPQQRHSDVRPPRPARPLSGIRLQPESPRERFAHSTSMSNLRVPEWTPNARGDYKDNSQASSETTPLTLNLAIKPPRSPRVLRTPDSGLGSASQTESMESSPRSANPRHEVIHVPPLQILRSSCHDVSTGRPDLTPEKNYVPNARLDVSNGRHKNSEFRMPYTKTSSLRNTLSPPRSSSSNDSSRQVSPLSSSSQQRPLGLRHCRSTEWDRELWKRWDMLTSDSGDDLDEQETLV